MTTLTPSQSPTLDPIPADAAPGEPLRPEWLTPDDWPFTVRSLPVGDHTVAYTDTGEGPTVLLVHAGMWSFVWREVIERLRDDFRCVTLDTPGNGLTQGPARVGLGDAAAAVDALVEHLDLADMTLVAHDLGGPAALHAAGAWPERVARLAAVNSFGWRPEGRAFRGMLAVMGSAPVRGADAATAFLPRMTSTRFGVGRHLDRHERRVFRQGMDRRGRDAFHRYLDSARRHDYATVDRAVAALADRPLVTVFGEHNDPLGFQPQWKQRFPDCRQVVIAGGKHFPMCDDPAAVADAVRDQWRDRAG